MTYYVVRINKLNRLYILKAESKSVALNKVKTQYVDEINSRNAAAMEENKKVNGDLALSTEFANVIYPIITQSDCEISTIDAYIKDNGYKGIVEIFED